MPWGPRSNPIGYTDEVQKAAAQQCIERAAARQTAMECLEREAAQKYSTGIMPADLAQKQYPMGKFWMVKNLTGGPAVCYHDTRESACEEAIRLAKIEAGKRFVVLEAVQSFEVPIYTLHF